MNRIKRGQQFKIKRKRLLSKAKGFRGASGRLYRMYKQQVLKSETNKYIHRKLKKRFMRKLWIVRINAFMRLNRINYSRFIRNSYMKNLSINRKIISQLSLYDSITLQNTLI